MRPDAVPGSFGQSGAVRGPSGPAAGPGMARRSRESFADSLAAARAGGSVKFSAHATERLAERKISFTAAQMARVQQATDLAARRGSRDALLMLDELGLVVNVRNRTVLTALDLRTMNDGIVTNIDSTILVRKD